MPVGSVSTAVPPQITMALEAIASSLQSEQAVAAALFGGGATGAALASNPGLGQVVDLSV